ncbi:hypothetical protein N7466_009602 [Penicillium verhagenii]|uniref:uncharacterized protein n=1 Tax=Penicillium verhagenii TaxID=1562060 RepID=UPI0025450AC4|nr:uncharacterized protein N7466_009602 [Penicillium verhagenii]KAJ5921276.1 hypothetical protein N7466_009602 [Penicillium verhagenii]
MAGLRMLVAAGLAGLVPISWAQQFADTGMFAAYTGLSNECQGALAANVIPTATSDPGYIYIPTYYPTAPGTLANCTAYRNYTDTTNIMFNVTDKMMIMLNSCLYLSRSYEVSMDQLKEWNPILSGNVSTCALQPGYSYCMLGSEDSIIPDESAGSFCLSINATEPTTVSNCNCFTQVSGYMNNGDYTCSDIKDDFELTVADLVAWNPWLAGDCDTKLYLNITGNDKRALCIGVDTNTKTTTSSTSPAPTPADTVVSRDDCDEYHTVAHGDSCASIESLYDITFAELYKWNPAIGWVFLPRP